LPAAATVTFEEGPALTETGAGCFCGSFFEGNGHYSFGSGLAQALERLEFWQSSEPTRIDDGCFLFCPLRSIDAAASAKILGRSCFSHCLAEALVFGPESRL
jgi:hypothetical protein